MRKQYIKPQARNFILKSNFGIMKDVFSSEGSTDSEGNKLTSGESGPTVSNDGDEKPGAKFHDFNAWDEGFME